jgi:hypothetical protein
MGMSLGRDGESVREGGGFRERALRDCCRQRPPRYLPTHARESFVMGDINGRQRTDWTHGTPHCATQRASEGRRECS